MKSLRLPTEHTTSPARLPIDYYRCVFRTTDKSINLGDVALAVRAFADSDVPDRAYIQLVTGYGISADWQSDETPGVV